MRRETVDDGFAVSCVTKRETSIVSIKMSDIDRWVLFCGWRRRARRGACRGLTRHVSVRASPVARRRERGNASRVPRVVTFVARLFSFVTRRGAERDAFLPRR